MLKLESQSCQQVVVDPSVESETQTALKTRIHTPYSEVRRMRDAVRDRVEERDKIARIGGLVKAVRGKLMFSLGSLIKKGIRGDRMVSVTSREAVGQLLRRIVSVFQEEATRKEMRVDQADHKVVCDISTYTQGLQK